MIYSNCNLVYPVSRLTHFVIGIAESKSDSKIWYIIIANS